MAVSKKCDTKAPQVKILLKYQNIIDHISIIQSVQL